MKMERNKIVFIGILGCLLAFILLYALGMREDGEGAGQLDQPLVPELTDAPKEFDSRLEALEAIKEARESPKPSLYGEARFDSMGRFDRDLEIRERQRIVDSIYKHGRIDYGEGAYRVPKASNVAVIQAPERRKPNPPKKEEFLDLAKAHAAFFAPEPMEKEGPKSTLPVLAWVDGQQTVRDKDRLELRLGEDLLWNGKLFKRNTRLHGFVSFRANRVMVSLDQIAGETIPLTAHDFLDGGEGIHVRNSYREEAQREVVDDLVQDINLPGAPQLGGLKQLFRRSNRRVKVTIHDQYKLYLKP